MASQSPRYKWYVMFLLFLAAGLNYGDRTAITAVFPLLRKELGMSDIALGATGSFFLWSYAVVSPFAGFLGDRMSRARLLSFSLAAWSLVMLASALAQSATQLLALRIVLGIAEAAYIPAATALIADHHDSDTRAKAMGIHLAGFSFGMVAGGWLSGYLGDHVGWRPSFTILGGAGLLLAVVCLATLRDTKAGAATVAGTGEPRLSLLETIRQLLRVPSFVILTVELVMSGTVNWVFINWLPLFFKETFALSLAMAGLHGTLWIQGGRIAGVTLGGLPSDRLARKHPRYRLLLMACLYLLAAPILLTFGVTKSFVAITVAIFFYNLIVGMGYVNAQPLLCEFLPVHIRSTAIGIMNMSSCLVGGAGILLAGALKSDVGLAKSFSTLTYAIVAVSLMLMFAYRKILPKDLERVRVEREMEAKAAMDRA